jgi:hypothetical protein
MNNSQTTWTLFGIGLVLSLVFLSVLIRTNYDLEQMQARINSQELALAELERQHALLALKVQALKQDQLQTTKDLALIKTLQENQANELYRMKNRKR